MPWRPYSGAGRAGGGGGNSAARRSRASFASALGQASSTTNSPEELPGSVAGSLPVNRREQQRLEDLLRKKNVRRTTKLLQWKLWELETEAWQREKAAGTASRAPSSTLHAVIVAATRRVRQMRAGQSKGAAGGGASSHMAMLGDGGLSHSDVAAGMDASHSVGVLWVCLDDWVVRRSNKAMELLCPFELIKGYAGLEMSAFVHPDDHLQLQVVQQEQIHSFKDGDTLVLSVRMLRACQDQGTLVMGWRRQILEVAHVAADQEHGGKLHVLFTCVLEPDSIAPLVFDEADRELFSAAARAASGQYIVDVHRTSMGIDGVVKLMHDAGLKDPNPQGMSQLRHWLGGLSDTIISWIRSATANTLNSLVKFHTMLGLAPDGTPWVQQSVALHPLGFGTPWRVFNNASASGEPLANSPGEQKETVVYGVPKPALGPEGEITIGVMGLVLSRAGNKDMGGRNAAPSTPLVLALLNHQYVCGPEGGVLEPDWACFWKSSPGLTSKVELTMTRTAPPDPGIADLFWRFGAQRRTAASHLFA